MVLLSSIKAIYDIYLALKKNLTEYYFIKQMICTSFIYIIFVQSILGLKLGLTGMSS